MSSFMMNDVSGAKSVLDLDRAMPGLAAEVMRLAREAEGTHVEFAVSEGRVIMDGRYRDIEFEIGDDEGEETLTIWVGRTTQTLPQAKAVVMDDISRASPQVEALLARLDQVFNEAREMGYPGPFAFAADGLPTEKEHYTQRLAERYATRDEYSAALERRQDRGAAP